MQSKHIQKLDMLRGVAIIAVFSYHCFGFTFGMDRLKFDGMWLDLSSAPTKLFYVFYPLTFGWIGVSLFFVISGFCIHLSFLKNSNFSVLNFYWRRFWRIYPPYILAVIAFSILSHIDITSFNGLLQLLFHIFLVHNLLPLSFYSGINPSFWSIETEAKFYLMYPLMLYIRKKYGIGNVLLLTLGISLLWCLIGVFIQDWNQDMKPAIWSFPAFLWFDWVWGAFIAERYIQGRRAFTSSAYVIIPLLLVFILSTTWRFGYILNFSLASVICAVLLVAQARNNPPFSVLCRSHADRLIILVWRLADYLRRHVLEIYLNSSRELSVLEKIIIPIGLCSYSFYLWHQPLLPKFLHIASINGIYKSHLWNMTFGLFFSLLLTSSLSWLLYKYIEKPSVK